jgi:hypothetical protein
MSHGLNSFHCGEESINDCLTKRALKARKVFQISRRFTPCHRFCRLTNTTHSGAWFTGYLSRVAKHPLICANANDKPLSASVGSAHEFPGVQPTASPPPRERIKDSCFPGAYIRSPARTHINQTLTPKTLSKMRYLAILLIVIIFATLAVAFYGWYRHLRDDEDDLV